MMFIQSELFTIIRHKDSDFIDKFHFFGSVNNAHKATRYNKVTI